MIFCVFWFLSIFIKLLSYSCPNYTNLKPNSPEAHPHPSPATSNQSPERNKLTGETDFWEITMISSMKLTHKVLRTGWVELPRVKEKLQRKRKLTQNCWWNISTLLSREEVVINLDSPIDHFFIHRQSSSRTQSRSISEYNESFWI